MKKILFSFCALAALAIGCGTKDATEPTLPLTKENILGKWNLNNQQLKISVLGFVQDTTAKFEAGSYIDFKSNNLMYVYSKVQGDTEPPTLDSAYYTIANSKLVIQQAENLPEYFSVDGNTVELTVSKLTDKQLQLYMGIKIPQSDSTFATDIKNWINCNR